MKTSANMNISYGRPLQLRGCFFRVTSEQPALDSSLFLGLGFGGEKGLRLSGLILQCFLR